MIRKRYKENKEEYYLSVVEIEREPMFITNEEDLEDEIDVTDGDCLVYIDKLDGYAEAWFDTADELYDLLDEDNEDGVIVERVYGVWGPFSADEVEKMKEQVVYKESELPDAFDVLDPDHEIL